MNNPKLNHAMRQLRYWQNVVRRLTSDTEKEEAEKRDIPPTPPIERKGEEEKEDHYPTRARATVPTIEQAKSYAEVCIKDSTPEKVEEWFAMCRGDDWCDADGQPIRNWHRNLNRFVMNYALFAKLRDPERIYDCRRKDEPKADPAAAARERRAKEIADELRRKGIL